MSVFDLKTDPVTLLFGDCLERMKEIPDGSVDMILTDPPYGTVKGINNIDHGLSNKTEWDNKLESDLFLKECNRVLKKNKALILFGQEPYTSELIINAHKNIPFSYRKIWLKDHFANSLIAKKAPVNYFEDIIVFFKKHDLVNKNPLALYVKELQENKGLFWNGDLLTSLFIKEFGSKSKNNAKAVLKHILNWEYVQFTCMTEKHYKILKNTLGIDKSLDEMKKINDDYKNITKKTFNLPPNQKYKSNVLEYKKDYDGYHPTQKPVALITDLIKTYTNENETVLDFTMGSGTTGVACKNINRKFIGIELDPKYYGIACERILTE